MPTSRSKKSKTHQEFPWQGRLYAIRVLFTAMVLLMLVVSDAACHNQLGAHFWLILSGAVYPHLGHLLLGRFEGRLRRGEAVLVIDGVFSGAVMATIGLVSAPSAVLAAVNLFNWMAVGGPPLLALGLAAALAGIIIADAPAILAPIGSCTAADSLAGVVLLAYFFIVGRFIHHHIGKLRQQHAQFQVDADATADARKLADRALTAVLPARAADVLSEKGELPTQALDCTTVLLFDFAWSQPPSIADLADCFEITDAIISRHGFEAVKTFGGRYLAISQAPSGPDDAVAAAKEINNFLRDHGCLVDSPAARAHFRACVDCGAVSAGLVQPSRLNYEVVGEPIEALNALANLAADQALGTLLVSPAARNRMKCTAEGDAAEQNLTLQLSSPA